MKQKTACFQSNLKVEDVVTNEEADLQTICKDDVAFQYLMDLNLPAVVNIYRLLKSSTSFE